jgi:hypothetical protein
MAVTEADPDLLLFPFLFRRTDTLLLFISPFSPGVQIRFVKRSRLDSIAPELEYFP